MGASALCGHSGTLNFRPLGPQTAPVSSCAPLLGAASQQAFLRGRSLQGPGLAKLRDCAVRLSCFLSALNAPRKPFAERRGRQTVVKCSEGSRFSSERNSSYGLVLPLLLLSTCCSLPARTSFRGSLSFLGKPPGRGRGLDVCLGVSQLPIASCRGRRGHPRRSPRCSGPHPRKPGSWGEGAGSDLLWFPPGAPPESSPLSLRHGETERL